MKKPEAISELPDNFNWEDINGYDFTNPVNDQGGCGSCYLFSTNSMLESRLKIWYGVEKSLSVAHTMQCCYLTEGCDGGHGFLAGLCLEHFPAVDA